MTEADPIIERAQESITVLVAEGKRILEENERAREVADLFRGLSVDDLIAYTLGVAESTAEMMQEAYQQGAFDASLRIMSQLKEAGIEILTEEPESEPEAPEETA